MHVDVERQLRSLRSFVTLFNARNDVAHATGETRDAQQARILVQHLMNRLAVQLSLAH